MRLGGGRALEPIEFGDYLLLKKLASGGMGEVHLARQVRGAGFDRYLAIKRILPELTGDDEFVRMFLDEARLAAHLTHPNVVEIHDLGICGDQYFIAMEFLEGRDLRRVMSRLSHRQRALPGAHAIHVIYHAAEGLHYAHELTDPAGKPQGIIHRDVSPQNIFITFHGTVKVLDFGIAKAESRSVQTRTGGLKGKYPYMSPEQVRGEAIDRRSDIFSLGVVLWETTVGRRLFRRENDLLTLNAVLKCEVPSPSSLMDRYPPELEAIVLRALAKDPEARHPTCRALQEDLEGFMAQNGLLLSPQKLGRSVTKLFSDEPCTVTEILESLKEKPRTKSLLHDDEPDSDRSGAVVRHRARGEASETSSPSASVVPEASSQSIPGLGGVPVQGFESPEAASGSDSSSGPSGSEVVEVSWSPESDSDPEGAVDLDPVTAEPAPATDGDDEPRTAENLVPPGFEGARMPTARTPAVAGPSGTPDAVEAARERADPSGVRAPGGAREPDPAPPLDPWLAAVPTALNVPSRLEPPVADRPTSRPRPLAPPGATATDGPREAAGLSTRTMALLLAAGVVVLALLLWLVVPLLSPPSPRGRAAPPSDQGATAGAERPAPEPPPDPAPEPPPDPAPEPPPDPAPPGPGDDAGTATADTGDDADWVGPEQDAAALGEDGDAASAAPPARPLGTRVTLATAPPGLSLYVAGRRLGTSPVTLRLAPGSHSIRVQSKALGVDFTTSVRVPSQDGSRELIAVPQGTLALKVRPYAEVFVDGRRLGLTPMPPAKLYIGRRHVRLVNDSLGRTVTRTVEIRPGERAVLTVDMGAAP